MHNWALSYNENALDKWVFPDISMPPKEYMLIRASFKDRSENFDTRTFVKQGDRFKYFISTSKPSPQSANLNFDDTSWFEGVLGFRYADNNDATALVVGTKSIYTRTNLIFQRLLM